MILKNISIDTVAKIAIRSMLDLLRKNKSSSYQPIIGSISKTFFLLRTVSRNLPKFHHQSNGLPVENLERRRISSLWPLVEGNEQSSMKIWLID